MERLIQIIRNSYIRFEGLIYQIFGLFGKVFGLLNQFFGFLSKLFGLTESNYILEDSARDTKQTEVKPDIPTSTPQSSPPATSSTRRRPDANMDYFLKLAEKKKASK